jgi:peptidoglycan/xylan/chitin deacetylase (PgdA/CDA1 family)
MFYFINTPGWLKRWYPSCTWQINTTQKIIYLTFDDGPHPVATPFVLAELKKVNAKATFFCIGKNVATQKDLYNKIIEEGHTVGNHTFNHLNGWKTKRDLYVENIETAQKLIDSNLFRPPYGKITFGQLRYLSKKPKPLQVVMWSVLSADFDTHVSQTQCLNNVIKNTGNGSIVVFHDSEKALEKLQFTLPKVLAYFAERGFKFESIIG